MSADMVRRVSALLRSRPPSGCDVDTRAAWFGQKADTFDAIAAQDPLVADEAGQMAQLAGAEARALRRGEAR